MISLLNILNLLSVSLSLVFQVFLVRHFGVALQTDVYYLSTAIISFTLGIVGCFINLYMPVYSDLKARDEEESKRFTGAVLVLIFLVGAFFSALVFITAPFIVSVFATGFSPEKVSFCAGLVRILSVSILFSSLAIITNANLNANMFMLITFSTTITTPLFNLTALLFFAKDHGIQAIIYSAVIASIINFLVVSIFLKRKVGWKLVNPINQPNIVYLIKQSAVMQAGGFVAQLQGPIASNILSYFPTGYITLFGYASKLLNVLFSVINSPMLQVLYAKASNLLPRKKVDELRGFLTTTLISNAVLFIIVVIPAVVLFKEMFGFLLSPKVTSDEISAMYYLFLALIPYYLGLSFDVSFAVITIAMQRGRDMLKINSVFILLYGVLLVSTIKFLGIFAIPVALFIAEAYKSIAFMRVVNRSINIVDSDLVKKMIKFSVFIGFLVFLNALFVSDFLHSVYLNVMLAVLWIIFTGRDTIAAFQFMVRKGEVK